MALITESRLGYKRHTENKPSHFQTDTETRLCAANMYTLLSSVYQSIEGQRKKKKPPAQPADRTSERVFPEFKPLGTDRGEDPVSLRGSVIAAGAPNTSAIPVYCHSKR